MTNYQFQPVRMPFEFDEKQSVSRAKQFYDQIKSRRTIREFSDKGVPREVIDHCVLSAGTAPNGANLQPWHFAVVSSDKIKSQIREAAEAEEREFYNGRAPQTWLDALAPLGTDENKPFLQIAPYLIVVFAKSYDIGADGKQIKNYYASESVGIATGILITALHHCGLATLTHTPSPMKFLNQILKRPSNERPFVLLVTGYPSDDAVVPAITKKSLSQITSEH